MPPARRVLIVYSGGTIGMQQGQHGLVAAGGFAEKLRTRAQCEPGLPEWRWRELKTPVDSANIGTRHWVALRRLIVNGLAEERCDAALLLHGTDTLAYSAAALSFLLLELQKPVLLTGSMRPADAPGSDAWDNLFGALRALQQGVPNGVWLYFGGQLLHGARAYKHSSSSLQAFAERPCQQPPRLRADIPLVLDYRRPRSVAYMAVLPFYPGLEPETLRGVLQSRISTLILECYGSGTAPEDKRLLGALARANNDGMVLVAISQCPQGQVDFSQYAASHALQEAGVINGGCLGREAALGKLFSLRGIKLPPQEVKHWFTENLCGEFG